MPRPTESIRLLVSSDSAITEDQLLQLLEMRRNELTSHLDKMRLIKLSEVKCLQRESFFDGVFCSNISSASGLTLNTSGIFGHSFRSRKNTRSPSTTGWPEYIHIPADGNLTIWGLTREAQWIIATVTFTGDEGYKGRGREVATNVTINEVPLVEMLKLGVVTPKRVYTELSAHFYGHVSRRRDQLRNLELVEEDFRAEDMFLSLFP